MYTLLTGFCCIAFSLSSFLSFSPSMMDRSYDRAMALQRMQQAGVVLTTTESVLFDLMRDAKHPTFKVVSGLIKTHKPVDDALPKFV
jgi:hypothetical protein